MAIVGITPKHDFIISLRSEQEIAGAEKREARPSQLFAVGGAVVGIGLLIASVA